MFLIFTFHNTSFFMEQKQYTVVGGRNAHSFLTAAHITSQRRQIKITVLFLKQNKKYFSEQIKLDTFSMSTTKIVHIATHNSHHTQTCFYTEKITLHWIAFAVMTFI